MRLGPRAWLSVNAVLLCAAFASAWVALNAPRLARPSLARDVGAPPSSGAPPLPPQSLVKGLADAAETLERRPLFAPLDRDAPSAFPAALAAAGEPARAVDGAPAAEGAAADAAPERVGEAPIVRSLIDSPLTPTIRTEALPEPLRRALPSPSIMRAPEPIEIRQFVGATAVPASVRRSDGGPSEGATSPVAAAEPTEAQPPTEMTPPLPRPGGDGGWLRAAAATDPDGEQAGAAQDRPFTGPIEIPANISDAELEAIAAAAAVAPSPDQPPDAGSDDLAPSDVAEPPALRPETRVVLIEPDPALLDAGAILQNGDDEGLTLLGIYIVSDVEKRALLQTGEGDRVRVGIGDEIQGWRVVKMTDDVLTLRQGSSLIELRQPNF